MSDTLPRRRSLDSLKKEAKRWLDALRNKADDARARLERSLPDASAAPTLRDVQHALAVEHGFAGWTELKQRLTTLATPDAKALAPYEEKVQALLAAYRTGTAEAMERHWSLTWHRRTWSAMRTYVQLDIGRQVDDPHRDDDITQADAQFLIAREHGFENWLELVTSLSETGNATLLARPVKLMSRDSAGAVQSSGRSREWNVVLARLAEPDVVGLETGSMMTDAMLEEVSRFEHLTVLDLHGSNVTDEGMRHLARLPNLRHLDLSGASVTDRGLDVLRSLPKLETIRLVWTWQVTDAGINHLSHCEHLREVNLLGTHSGDGALRTLAGKEHLSQLRTGNAVTDVGLAALHDFPGFKQWQGGEPSIALLSPESGPNHLSLRGKITDGGMRALEGLDGLFGLDIGDSALGLTAAALPPLVTLPNLGWLSVDATDASMPHIAAMRQLRYLGCQDTDASDDGFVALSKSRSIEQIWGRRCHNLRTRGFSALASMPMLRGLSVSCKNVDDKGIALLPTFPALRELMPMDIPDEGYRHIGRCGALKSLVLMYCRDTSDVATEHIAGLSRLAKYFASYTKITDRTPELLSRMSSLEEITFDGCAGLTNDGIANLAHLPKLRLLRVSGQKLTEEVARPFGDQVRVNYYI